MADLDRWCPRTALVTGGASGIGRALAASLSALGAETLIVDRDGAALERTVHALAGRGTPVHGLAVDLTAAQAPSAVSDRLIEMCHGASVDVVVSNAGVLGPVGATLWEADLVEVRSAIETNLFAHMALAHRLLPAMVASGTRSRYVFTGSMAAFASGNRSVPYATTKAALVALARGLATELEGTRVRPAVVCPGFVRTPMTRGLAVPAGAGGDSELTPQQVADAVVAGLRTDDLYIFPSPDTAERLLRYTSTLLGAGTVCPEQAVEIPAGVPARQLGERQAEISHE